MVHRARHEMKNPTGLGRISAQLAKQVLFQKVREAERDTVYNEYIGRVGGDCECHRQACGRLRPYL